MVRCEWSAAEFASNHEGAWRGIHRNNVKKPGAIPAFPYWGLPFSHVTWLLKSGMVEIEVLAEPSCTCAAWTR